jgi:hypothetical protein
MSKHHKHRVTVHRWTDGVLQTTEHLFESMADAMSWSEALNADSIKVYNDTGNLVHVATNTQQTQQTYA